MKYSHTPGWTDEEKDQWVKALDIAHNGRRSPLPEDAAERKTYPMYSGLIKYFPDALAAVAHQSWLGNQQHHPDKPLHWDRSKSSDELDALMRHVAEEDWVAVAWRALAHLQKELEK